MTCITDQDKFVPCMEFIQSWTGKGGEFPPWVSGDLRESLSYSWIIVLGCTQLNLQSPLLSLLRRKYRKMRLNVLIRRIDTPTPSPNLIGLRVDQKPTRYFNRLVRWIGLRWIIYWRKVHMTRCSMPPGCASWDIRDVGDEWARDQGTPNCCPGEFYIVIWKSGLSYDLNSFSINGRTLGNMLAY